jgi:hypothetical protein
MMLEGAGWLCEPNDAPSESWMSDVPWLKANHRSGHYTTVRHREGVSRIFDGLSFVKRHDMVRQLFYGNPVIVESEMTGFAARYSTKDPGAAHNAVCVLDAAGRGDALTSAWVIAWGPRSIFMVTPDGEPPAGPGELGLVVADWRFAFRIANIGRDTSRSMLEAFLDDALLRLPVYPSRDSEKYRTTIYVSSDLREVLGADIWRGCFVRAVGLRDNEPRVS